MLHSLEVNFSFHLLLYSVLDIVNAKLTLVLSVLQKEYDKTKTQRDQEEKLIVSAWYNMVSVYTYQLGGVSFHASVDISL